MRNRRLPSALLVATVLSMACAHRAPAEPPPRAEADPPASVAQVPEVRVFGALREMMHDGRLEGRVDLADVAAPGVYGVGALSELRGEVTFVDGEAWLSYPDGEDAFRLEVTHAPQEAAALLVLSTVSGWRQLPIERPIEDDALDAFVASKAAAAGLDLETPFPFLITGPVAELDWHVIDGTRVPPDARGHQAHIENSVRGRLDTEAATLVGFHSKRHHRIFTHMDRDTHVHVVAREEGITGHVDHVVIREGAVLWLPELQDDSP